MQIQLKKRLLTACLILVMSPGALAAEFQSTSTVEQIRNQIEKLPKDDIWWSVNGEDMGWNARNLQTIHPTVPVYRAGPVRMLDYELNAAIADHPVDTPSGSMGFRDFLDSDYSRSFGVVVVRRGKIVFEHYARMQAHERPTMWSVSKVLVSALVSILQDRGLVDVDEPIEAYIPEMAASSYAGTTVRNILDMASGIDCSEEYYERSSCYNLMMQAMGETWWDENSPDNPYAYLAGLQAARYAEQGTSFEYASINTDILGWLVEKITGMPFQDALSREIWTRTGMEGDAAYVAPRYGVPHWDGGFTARMRDMARFGMLYTPSYGVVSDSRIISGAHVDALLNEGRPELWANPRWPAWVEGTHEGDQVKYNAWQWDLIWNNGDIYKGGWAGQGLLVNPKRDLVAVYTGYFKDDEGSELPVLPRLRDVLNAVFGEEGNVSASSEGTSSTLAEAIK
jgi:CubicO group peptidase (beta-lactamase class C family)